MEVEGQRSLMKRLLEVQDEMLLPLASQLKEIFPDTFFVVEEGFQNGERVFSRVRFIFEKREEAVEWVNLRQTRIIRKETGTFPIGQTRRTEERFWTSVYDHSGSNAKLLRERNKIIAGEFFCIAEMSRGKLAARLLHQF